MLCVLNMQVQCQDRTIDCTGSSPLEKCGGHLAEELETYAIILAAVNGLCGEISILGLDEEATQTLNHARGYENVGAPKVEFSLVLRGTQQG